MKEVSLEKPFRPEFALEQLDAGVIAVLESASQMKLPSWEEDGDGMVRVCTSPGDYSARYICQIALGKLNETLVPSVEQVHPTTKKHTPYRATQAALTDIAISDIFALPGPEKISLTDALEDLRENPSTVDALIEEYRKSYQIGDTLSENHGEFHTNERRVNIALARLFLKHRMHIFWQQKQSENTMTRQRYEALELLYNIKNQADDLENEGFPSISLRIQGGYGSGLNATRTQSLGGRNKILARIDPTASRDTLFDPVADACADEIRKYFGVSNQISPSPQIARAMNHVATLFGIAVAKKSYPMMIKLMELYIGDFSGGVTTYFDSHEGWDPKSIVLKQDKAGIHATFSTSAEGYPSYYYLIGSHFVRHGGVSFQLPKNH